MIAPRRVVNVSELTEVGAKFVELPDGLPRCDFSAMPRNMIERMVRRPRLSRYRAAAEAVLAASGNPIISHLPRMTAAVSSLQTLMRRTSPHLAFSFNFTELPQGLSRRYLAAAFKSVDEFFVFSAFEKQLYAEFFALPADRFTRLIWTQDVPMISDEPSPFALDSYVTAVGGEGRDYTTLVRAAEILPDIQFVIVARPYNQLRHLPSNVRFMTNVPLSTTWRIAAESSCLIVPLIDRSTCCGHITLVSAELLGIPVVSTYSEATREYTEDVALCEPGDAEALARLIRVQHDDVGAQKAAAASRILSKRAKYDRAHWDQAVGCSIKRYF